MCFRPSILATVPPIKARNGLHLFSVFFCPTRTNQGHSKHRGFFFFFFFFIYPAVLLRCLLQFLSREGFSQYMYTYKFDDQNPLTAVVSGPLEMQTRRWQVQNLSLRPWCPADVFGVVLGWKQLGDTDGAKIYKYLKRHWFVLCASIRRSRWITTMDWLTVDDLRWGGAFTRPLVSRREIAQCL